MILNCMTAIASRNEMIVRERDKDRRQDEDYDQDCKQSMEAEGLQHAVQSKTVLSEMQPMCVGCIYGALLVS